MVFIRLLIIVFLTLQQIYAFEKRTFDTSDLDEASGLLASRMYPGIFWSHNDSGGKARLYAINSKNMKVISQIKIKGAKNIDWEDLSYHNGKIIIADTGNNKNNRNNLKLYVIDEPNPFKDKKVDVDKTINFTFSDQKSLKPKEKNFDCEAIFSFNGALYLLSKHRADTNTTLYHLQGNSAQKVMEYPIGGRVSGADSDGKRIVVLSYENIYLFEPKKGVKKLLSGVMKRKYLGDIGQIEGVTLEGELIHIISESGSFFTIPIKELYE
jgi:hypothetical protein